MEGMSLLGTDNPKKPNDTNVNDTPMNTSQNNNNEPENNDEKIKTLKARKMLTAGMSFCRFLFKRFFITVVGKIGQLQQKARDSDDPRVQMQLSDAQQELRHIGTTPKSAFSAV